MAGPVLTCPVKAKKIRESALQFMLRAVSPLERQSCNGLRSGFLQSGRGLGYVSDYDAPFGFTVI